MFIFFVFYQIQRYKTVTVIVCYKRRIVVKQWVSWIWHDFLQIIRNQFSTMSVHHRMFGRKSLIFTIDNYEFLHDSLALLLKLWYNIIVHISWDMSLNILFIHPCLLYKTQQIQHSIGNIWMIKICLSAKGS